jgi:hypothetical protein
MTDKAFAKDVAKQLDRRRMRRKLGLWAAFAALIALAVSYVTCGQGFGLGGKGKGKGEGAGSGSAKVTLVDAGPSRCAIRIAAAGITVNGKPSTRAAAVMACKATSGADVVVTGDARQGDWDELEKALEAAGVSVYMKQGGAP